MNGNYLREFLTRLTMNYPFELFILNNLVIRTKSRYRPTDLFPMRVLGSSYHDSESCRIDILYLIQFIDKGFALKLART
jgi:hypothetical protein